MTEPREAGDGATNDGLQQVDASDVSARDGSICAPACDQFSLCAANGCLSVTDVGWPSPTGYPEVATNGFLQAIQVSVDVCGVVTGLGFFLADAGLGERYRLALYTDDGGNPANLVTETTTGTTQLGLNEQTVSVNATVGCDGDDYYWIVGTWNEHSIELVAEQSTALRWIRVLAVNDSADYLTNGMPATFPAGGMPITNPQPHVFVSVAHP